MDRVRPCTAAEMLAFQFMNDRYESPPDEQQQSFVDYRKVLEEEHQAMDGEKDEEEGEGEDSDEDDEEIEDESVPTRLRYNPEEFDVERDSSES